jgi:glycosyltransferase involved in cell wall biosynthesis
MRLTIVNGFFLPVPPALGGSTEKIWNGLAREFAARGHRVTFISRSWPGFPASETIGGVVHRRVRGAGHSRFLAANLARDFFWGVRVARVLPEADIIICNTVTLPVWIRRIRPSAGRVVPVISRMPKGHGLAYRGADAVLAVSAAAAERLRRENPRLEGRIVCSPNPIDWGLHARSASRSPAADRPLVIGYAGRVHPEKGIALLLAAAARLSEQPALPRWELEIVGPAGIRAGGGGEAWLGKLLAEFESRLGPRLRVAGPEFDTERLARRYGGMDVFCYPSLSERGETFGVAVAEAMAAGCAPVVSALPCFGELVREGETGLVFDHAAPGADSRLAEAISRLLGDSRLRQEVAARAQAHVRRFDFQAVAESLLAELEKICGRIIL